MQTVEDPTCDALFIGTPKSEAGGACVKLFLGSVLHHFSVYQECASRNVFERESLCVGQVCLSSFHGAVQVTTVDKMGVLAHRKGMF